MRSVRGGLKTFPGQVRRTADPSVTLGMTKGTGVVPPRAATEQTHFIQPLMSIEGSPFPCHPDPDFLWLRNKIITPLRFVLYQGATLVVPQRGKKVWGFRVCVRT
jgi:hypothetical protein